MQGIRLNEPAARFLFSILAIESLATYIEDIAPDKSPFVALRTIHISKIERETCIKDTLAKWLDDNPTMAVEKAYSNYVTGVTGKLKRHLEKILASDTESYDLLFKKKIDNKTLYDLRHYVVHGSANTLSETQREQIQHRVWDAERIARRYIYGPFLNKPSIFLLDLTR